MVAMSVLWVFLGGAVGGILRYLAVVLLPARESRRLSPGLIVVNLVGSFVLGLAVRWVSDAGYLLVATGLCGSLTTFSTLAVEVLRVWHSGHHAAAMGQAAVMVFGGFAAAGVGLLLGGLI